MEEKTKILSNGEISNFLRAINGRDLEPEDFRKSAYSRKIKIYDFMHPDRFSGYMYELSGIHDNLAQSWTNLFSRHFQKLVHFHVTSADALTHEAYIRSCPYPTSFLIIQGFLDSVPLPLSFVIEVDRSLSIEQSILNDMSKSLLDEYSQIWNKRYGMKLEFNLKSIETNPQYVNVDAMNEMGLLISMEANLYAEGMINIFLPYLFLKPLLLYLPRIKKYKNQEEEVMENRFKTAIETGLENVKVQVVVELGRAVKTLKEIQGTGEGTIMQIEKFAGEPVDIFVNNVLFGKGEVVVLDENFGVRFIEIVEQKKPQSAETGDSLPNTAATTDEGETACEDV